MSVVKDMLDQCVEYGVDNMSIGIGTIIAARRGPLSGCARKWRICSDNSPLEKRSDDYAGIGLNRGLTIGLRSQLSATAGYW